MVEIVFSESALGSMKCALGFGKGPYRDDGPTGVILGTQNPPPEAVQAALDRARARRRREWEAAVPLEARREDLFAFPLALSVGDLSDGGLGPSRAAALEELFRAAPGGTPAREVVANGLRDLESVQARHAAGEAVRIWYSQEPDELCGLYWLLAQLPPEGGAVYLLPLPEWDRASDGSLAQYRAWGEVPPGAWGRLARRQEPAPALLRRVWAAAWQRLCRENSPLRAVVNGRLHSVPETFYDSFILRELRDQPDRFHMARLIGDVLGKYQLGIGDAWVAGRIEAWIRQGLLCRETTDPEGKTGYRCMLKKNS